MMRQVMVIANSIYLFCCLFSSLALAQELNFHDFPLSSTAKSKLEMGENYLLSTVKTINSGKNQQFKFTLAARHPKSCRFALKKLKNYENYRQYIEMVTTSLYDKKTKELYIELDPPVISENLVLNFKIDRIENQGLYPFTFDRGFLNGLLGSISVFEYKHRCIFVVQADWTGQKTRYSDQVLSLFAGTAAEIAMNKLIRISSSY